MNRQILRLALPNIISNITVPLLGLVDLGLMGHLSNPRLYIGAIALGGVIFNILYWAFAFIRMGTSGFTAQNYGEGSSSKCIITLTRALLISILGALLLLVLQTPIEKFCFFILEGDDHLKEYARTYYYIRIWAAPAVISLYAFTGWFIGMQNAWKPMIISIVINIVNIFCSYYFVYHLYWDIKGVAWGTVVAQYAGVFLSILFLFASYKKYFKYWSYTQFKQLKAFKQFFKVNGHIFLRMLCLILVFTFFTSKSAAAEQNDILSANMVLLQFLYIFSYFMDSYAYAAEALVGKFIGQKNKTSLLISIRYLFIWGISLSILCAFIYLIGNKKIITLITPDIHIIKTASQYAIWIILLPLFSFASFIWDGIYIGATASKYMLITMTVATFIFFLPSYFILKPYAGNHGLWIAMLLFMVARGIFQTIWWKKAIMKNYF